MKWLVGTEYDENAFKRLGVALRKVGFDLNNNWYGVGGSQEISHWELSSIEGKLIVEAETYIGLSVEGEASLVEKVKNEFSK